MSYFVWTADLDTGINIIDSQHRRIVDYINQIHDAIDLQDANLVRDVLDQLVDYTISHFAFEEQLMQRGSYGLYDAHKRVHIAFTDKVKQYHARVNGDGDVFATARKVLTDLQIWLTNHIKHDDADYVRDVKRVVDKGWVSKMLTRFFR